MLFKYLVIWIVVFNYMLKEEVPVGFVKSLNKICSLVLIIDDSDILTLNLLEKILLKYVNSEAHLYVIYQIINDRS